MFSPSLWLYINSICLLKFLVLFELYTIGILAAYMGSIIDRLRFHRFYCNLVTNIRKFKVSTFTFWRSITPFSVFCAVSNPCADHPKSRVTSVHSDTPQMGATILVLDFSSEKWLYSATIYICR